jgi:hypothetical protein
MLRFSFWFVCIGSLWWYTICQLQSSTSDSFNGILHRNLEKSHEKEGKKKSRQPHHRSSSSIKHTKDQLSTSYGSDLPSFAFDYSEYFVNAMISSSSNEKEQYLTILLLGHHSIYEDFPFEALSTDEKALSSWNQALKLWKKEDIRKHRFSQKRYSCLITSSLNIHHPYSSQISWLEEDNDEQSSRLTNTSCANLNHNFEIIHCKMPSNRRFPGSSSSSSSSLPSIKYLVDILVSDSSFSPSSNQSNSSKVIFSFSISTNKTYLGFPYQQPSSLSSISSLGVSVNKSRRLSRSPLSFDKFLISNLRKSAFGAEGIVFLLFFLSIVSINFVSLLAFIDLSLNRTIIRDKVWVCIGNIRPVQSPRPLIGIPSLFEMIEHLLLLGVDHIILGIMVTW